MVLDRRLVLLHPRHAADRSLMQSLGDFQQAMRPSMLVLLRDQLVTALTPMFATAEQRAEAKRLVAAMTDEDIEEIWARWGSEAAKSCLECGRPYKLTIETGEDREAALQAIHEYDAAHGRIVPLPGYDHVHQVTRDEEGHGA